MKIEVEICKFRRVGPHAKEYVPELIHFIVSVEGHAMELYVELTAEEARKMAEELNEHAAMVEEAGVIPRLEEDNGVN